MKIQDHTDDDDAKSETNCDTAACEGCWYTELDDRMTMRAGNADDVIVDADAGE